MTAAVIAIENISKAYRLGVIGTGTFCGDLKCWWARRRGQPDPCRKVGETDYGNRAGETIWALRDIDLTIEQGEAVGIIGRNGAGKSTLLKILSRVTAPTCGEIRVRGRIASLLEVGTGFHPELTGRENVFLNGAIMGMSRSEVQRKFDEIVDFSGVEKFIDTPVKRYSSGMYVRLAFAVAAHLEPEILIIDEVLAVGDAEFQKKCLGKMRDVGRQGRTVLFVSHNMQAVRQLCTRGLVLAGGRAVFGGSASEAVENYLQGGIECTTLDNIDALLVHLPQDPVFKYQRIAVTQNNAAVALVDSGKPLRISIEYSVFEKTRGLRVYFDLCDTDDTVLVRSFHDEAGDGIPTVEPGRYVSRGMIPANFLAPAHYELRIRATIYNVRTFEPREGIRIKLAVERSGLANKAYLAEPIRGKLAPLLPWETQKLA